MFFNWTCEACHTVNRVDIASFSKESKVTCTCTVCKNVSQFHLELVGGLVEKPDFNGHIHLEGERCFQCPFYKQLESSWDYGDAYGRCILTDDYDDKDIYTVCCCEEKRLYVLAEMEKDKGKGEL